MSTNKDASNQHQVFHKKNEKKKKKKAMSSASREQRFTERNIWGGDPLNSSSNKQNQCLLALDIARASPASEQT